MEAVDPAGEERAERDRLAALDVLGLLDAPADDELQAVVRVAAAVAGVPFGTLNLIDADRQCQLTSTGFEGGDSSRADSMCALHFRDGAVVHVPDASLDPRYARSAWVDGRLGAVRLYASVPLVTAEGHALGSLCVFDTRPGRLSADRLERLADLGGVLLALFERRRQARVSAELAAQLERSNSELARFAAVASHDLRSPMTVVDGYLELLEDELADGPPLPRSWVAAARRSARRMVELTSSLLDDAALGAAVRAPEPADLAVLAREAVSDLGGGADVRVGPMPRVVCDAVAVRQLLQNLVGNALRHGSRDAARVDVRIDAERSGDAWVVSVADDGPGVPAQDRERVFEAFTSLPASGAGGHGLGLATCRRIVDRHGGRIWVDETPGGGATVRFTLAAVTSA